MSAPESIENTLNAVLLRHVKLAVAESEIPPERELKNMGLDSASAIDLLLDLEEVFAVVFPNEMLTAHTFRTASTLAAAIRELRTATGGGQGGT